MTCDEYQEQTSAMIDRELGDNESGVLFAHLSGCAHCRGSLRSALELRSDLSEQTPLLAPANLDDKVLRSVHATNKNFRDRKPIPMRLWKGRVSVPLPVLTMLTLLLILSSITLYSFGTKPQPQAQTVYVTTFPVVEVQGYFP